MNVMGLSPVDFAPALAPRPARWEDDRFENREVP